MENEELRQIIFTSEDGEQTVFYIVEQTKIAGTNYLLVADSEEEEATALILKEGLSEEDSPEVLYTVVEEEAEMMAIAKVFEEMLEDVEIQN